MPLGLLVALFIVVPLAELYVILKVGDLIGVVPTILLLAADSVLGAWLWRAQGRSAWRRFNLTLAEGRVPHREVVDGVLVIFGGALLITPGFLTDIAGAILLIPPSRAVVRRIALRRLGRRIVVGTGRPGTARPGTTRPGGRFDVEGTANEYDDSPQELER